MKDANFGKKVYKEIFINGKKLGKWCKLARIVGYDEKERVAFEEGDNSLTRYVYDINGYKIEEAGYFNNGDDFEYLYENEYDSNNNLIYSKKIDEWEDKSLEIWYEYDCAGNLIHKKDSKGFETWYKRDSNDNVVEVKDSDGGKIRNEYDENGYKIFTQINDITSHIVNDEYGNLVYAEFSDGRFTIREYEFNEYGKKVFVYHFLPI